ncbi:hypothetical protein VNO77_44007 [Canavalia gladiata]|uniref:Uncharacterized protein n=1 Tax=Canavalia gladiata TaxID=3824 RepID=A0AAN9JVV6_CANGL
MGLGAWEIGNTSKASPRVRTGASRLGGPDLLPLKPALFDDSDLHGHVHMVKLRCLPTAKPLMSISSRLIRIGWCSAEVYQGCLGLGPYLFCKDVLLSIVQPFARAHAIGTSWRFLILRAQIHSSSLGLEYQGSFYVHPISDGDASRSNLHGSLSISLVV